MVSRQRHDLDPDRRKHGTDKCLRDISTNQVTQYPSECQGHERPEETQQLDEMGDLGLDSGTKKGCYLDNWLNSKVTYRLV